MTTPAPRRIQVGGTLNPAQHVYIARHEDQDVLHRLSMGEWVNLFCSRQSGKSSLMVRVFFDLQHRGWCTALCDLTILGTQADAETYFRGLTSAIAKGLKISNYAGFWNQRTFDTPSQKFTAFVTELIPQEIDNPVAIFLDEIDSVLKLSFSADLFFALRGAYHELKRNPRKEPIVFCLAGAIAPYEFVTSAFGGSFDVGHTLALRDFSLSSDDFGEILPQLGTDSNHANDILRRVFFWTGGQPALTMRILAETAGCASPGDVDRFVKQFLRNATKFFGDAKIKQLMEEINMFFDQRTRHRQDKILDLYESILSKRQLVPHTNADVVRELILSGLVRLTSKEMAAAHNKVYKSLFGRKWIAERRSLPSLEIWS